MSNYDFLSLSPFDFEILAHDLLERELNLRLESFKSGRDNGIDLRYSCTSTKHTIIIQCKHYVGSGFSKLISHLKSEELEKVKSLNPSRYILITSVGLTPDNKAEIQKAMSPFIKNTVDIIGKTEINHLLAKHPQVEEANFKLWLTSRAVLDRVLHNAEITQTEFAIERVTKKLPLYVQNSCYPQAMKILTDSNVVVISGVPGIGKSTLAEMLLYSHLSRGYKPVVIRSDLREGRSLYQKNESQIFYYDDFLGQTFLRERHAFLLRNEDASLVDFVEMIRASPNAKLVMTTREHILSNALLASEKLRRSPLVDHKFTLEITHYSRPERARILYNHIYFSELPESYRKALIDEGFYEEILNHQNYNPRLIEWLSSYRRIQPIKASAYREFVRATLKNPQEIWRQAFQGQISQHARSLLLALFSLGGKAKLASLEPAGRELSAFQARKYNLALSTEGFKATLREVEGSFVSITNGIVDFLNPSIKDFVTAIIDAENIADLIQGAATFDQLVRLWQWSRQTKQPCALSAIGTTNEYFLAAIERTLARPYKQILQLKDVTAEYPLDLYPEARLDALLSIAEDVKSERLLSLVPNAHLEILHRWSEENPSFEETASILDSLEGNTWSALRLDPNIYSELRAEMLRKLDGASSFYDFYHVDEFLNRSAQTPTDVEWHAFSVGFQNYLIRHFRDELFDLRSRSEELDDMGSFMFKMMDEAGYAIKSEYDQIVSEIADRDHYEDQRADEDYGRWKDHQAFEKAGDEEIASMFDSLRQCP